MKLYVLEIVTIDRLILKNLVIFLVCDIIR
jgi:hypothetical protein